MYLTNDTTHIRHADISSNSLKGEEFTAVSFSFHYTTRWHYYYFLFLIYVHTKAITNVLIFELALEMSVVIDTFKMMRIVFPKKAFG